MDLDILITNCKPVIPGDDRHTAIPLSYLGISKGRISIYGSMETLDPDVQGQKTIDAKGALIMPGLVNGHNHCAMTLFRGLADDLPLTQWLNNHIFPAESRFVSPENVPDGCLPAWNACHILPLRLGRCETKRLSQVVRALFQTSTSRVTVTPSGRSAG